MSLTLLSLNLKLAIENTKTREHNLITWLHWWEGKLIKAFKVSSLSRLSRLKLIKAFKVSSLSRLSRLKLLKLSWFWAYSRPSRLKPIGAFKAEGPSRLSGLEPIQALEAYLVELFQSLLGGIISKLTWWNYCKAYFGKLSRRLY